MIRDYTPTDLPFINDLRETDLEDAIVLYGLEDPYEALRESVEASVEVFTYEENGLPMGLGGVAESDAIPGYFVWFVGNKDLDKVQSRKALIREGRVYLKERVRRYYRLGNFCGPNRQLHRALRLLGFRIIRTNNSEIFRIDICA